MSASLSESLRARGVLLADGAIGTNLFAMGLPVGGAPELWNVDAPDTVAALHRSFTDAGSDLVLTNSFGGNRHRLALHGSERRVRELNLAAARVARRVADAAGRPVLVGGSLGPTGEILAPLGDLAPGDAEAAFREQAEALAEGGVDVLWLETLSSREELEAGLRGCAGLGIPVVCTLSFDTNGRTMMGISPSDFASLCRETDVPPHAFGSNCGLGPAEVVAGILGLREAAREDEVLVAKANCGVPEFIDGEVRYVGTPGLMARYAILAAAAGARIVGGCCGTTAEHVRAMREAIDGLDLPDLPPPSMESVQSELGAVSAGALGDRPTRNARVRRRGRRSN